MNHRSLAFRLAAWYTILLSGAFALVGTGTFVGLQHYLRANMRETLKHRAAQIERILNQQPSSSSDALLASEIETRLAPESNSRYLRLIRDPSQIVFRSGPPSDRSFDPGAVDRVVNPPGSVPSGFDQEIRNDLHLILGSASVTTPSGRFTIETGSSTSQMEAVLSRLLDLLALLLPVLVACAAGGGYVLVNRALRPVDRISQTAEQISLQNLALRLPVVPSGDALERLSVSMNNMLGRLRDSVQASRRFVADASHELRTPLTVVKGGLQEIAGGADLSGDLHDRIGSVLEEVGRLECLVSGLLVLSRLDAGETQRDRTDVDLAELAHSTAEQMRLMAEDRGLAIDWSGLESTVVRGDRGRLKQVVVNLLDNAIRCTPRGGTITLISGDETGSAYLEVADTGIGIPAWAINQVFDRFFRVDEARSREDGGAGLGLSIVKSICAMHGAEIGVESLVGTGSRFRVTFPRRTSNAADAASAPAIPVPSALRGTEDRRASQGPIPDGVSRAADAAGTHA